MSCRVVGTLQYPFHAGMAEAVWSHARSTMIDAMMRSGGKRWKAEEEFLKVEPPLASTMRIHPEIHAGALVMAAHAQPGGGLPPPL